MVTITHGRERPEKKKKGSNGKKENPRRKQRFVEGYRLMGYDAMYEKTMIEVVDKRQEQRHIIELEDLNSGIRLMVSMEEDK